MDVSTEGSNRKESFEIHKVVGKKYSIFVKVLGQG
jgi:hypothetical protein